MRISDWSSDVCSSDLPRIVLLLLEQLQERAIGIVQQVARHQCDRAVHRDLFVDFAIAPESAAATVEQPRYPVRIGGAVAQEAAVVLGQAREAIARCARETGGAFGFDRLAQAFVDAFVRVQAPHPVLPALFDRESLLAAEAVDRPVPNRKSGGW